MLPANMRVKILQRQDVEKGTKVQPLGNQQDVTAMAEAFMLGLARAFQSLQQGHVATAPSATPSNNPPTRPLAASATPAPAPIPMRPPAPQPGQEVPVLAAPRRPFPPKTIELQRDYSGDMRRMKIAGYTYVIHRDGNNRMSRLELLED